MTENKKASPENRYISKVSMSLEMKKEFLKYCKENERSESFVIKTALKKLLKIK